MGEMVKFVFLLLLICVWMEIVVYFVLCRNNL